MLGSTLDGGQTLAAAAGGLAPDLPLILLVSVSRWVAGTPPAQIFGSLYYSSRWQMLLAPWHSLPLWSALLCLALWSQWWSASVFAASALLHTGVDFFVHAEDAHRQFWPFSNWRFVSPVSYWDNRHYGRLFRPFEMALAVAFALYVVTQHRSILVVSAVGLILFLYAAQIVYFLRRLRPTSQS